MQGLLDALDDGDEAITTALGRLRDDRGRIEEVLTRVTALMRPPADPFHERLVASYPQIRRFLPTLIDAIAFDSTTGARPVLDAYHALGRWLTVRPHATRLPSTEVPLDVVNASWEPHVRPTGAGTVNRAAYACCVLDQLRTGLLRRDVYAPASIRWGDPRAELLPPEAWDQQRERACEDLALESDPRSVIAQLARALDHAWRRTAAGMPSNPDFRIERREGHDRIVVTPLDAVAEPASLVTLRSTVESLIPEVEIADVPPEVHGWTGCLDEYTHISGSPTRSVELIESVSALLVSDACNRPHAGDRRGLPAPVSGPVELGGPELFRSENHAAAKPASSTTTLVRPWPRPGEAA